MIDEIAHPIDRVKPRTIGILVLENETQVAVRDRPIIVIGEDARSAGEQKRAIRGGVDHSAFIKGV